MHNVKTHLLYFNTKIILLNKISQKGIDKAVIRRYNGNVDQENRKNMKGVIQIVYQVRGLGRLRLVYPSRDEDRARQL